MSAVGATGRDRPVGRAARGDTEGASVGWGSLASAAPDLQVERSGVIASFIFNAAMIPGWPPPRPFAVPGQAKVLDAVLSAARPSDPDAISEGLGEAFGAPGRPGRLRRRLSALGRSRRLRVMLGLAALEAGIEAVLDALEEELLRIAVGEEDDDAGRRRLSV